MKTKMKLNDFDEMQRGVRYQSGFRSLVLACVLSVLMLILDMLGLRFTHASDALVSVMLFALAYFLHQIIIKGAFLDRYEEGNKKLYGILFLVVLIFQAIAFGSHMISNGYSLFAASPTLDDLPITASFFMFAVIAFSYYLRLWRDKRGEDTDED